jgi:hypothetical protein
VIVDLDQVTDDLYGISPVTFTAERDARVSEARSSGDRATAESLKKLRKPSVGAWLANQLARQRPTDLESLITLGNQLRAAQDQREGETIRRLSKARSEAVSSLVQASTSLANRSGQRVSDAAVEELEATLNAALVDPEAAESLRRGRLTHGLRDFGFGSGGGAGVAEEAGSVGPKTGDDRRTSKRNATREALASAQRELEQANREVERAKAESARAERDAVAAEATLKAARSVATDAVRRMKEAQKRAVAAERRVESARRKLRPAGS